MRTRVLGLVFIGAILVAFAACGGGDGETTDNTTVTDGGPACDLCEYNGQCYEAGDSFDADDGCNTCACSADGQVLCSEIACVAPDDGPPPGDDGPPPGDDGPPPGDEGPEPTDVGPPQGDESLLPPDGVTGEDSVTTVTDEGSLDVPPEPNDGPQGPPADATGPSDSPTRTAVISVKFSATDKCGGCHTGGGSGGHDCLSNYQDCLKSASSCPNKTVGACMLDRINDGTMPPGGGFIPPDWKTELQAWIDAGMPE